MVPSQEHLDRDEQRTLYNIARVLNSTLELDEVLQLVMDRVIEFVNADLRHSLHLVCSTGCPKYVYWSGIR